MAGGSTNLENTFFFEICFERAWLLLKSNEVGRLGELWGKGPPSIPEAACVGDGVVCGDALSVGINVPGEDEIKY